MKFTDLKLNEGIDSVNTTDRYNFKRLNVPLKEIKIVEPKSGNTTLIPSDALESLLDNRIRTSDEYLFAYKNGKLDDIQIVKNVDGKEKTIKFPGNLKDAIKDGIENSISYLPGVNEKVYRYLKDKMGISTIKEFNNSYYNGKFDNLNVPEENLVYDDFENIRILTERRSNESLLRVYHASVDINVAKYVYNHEWGNGPNSQAYGTGLYTCWTKGSAFDDIDIFGRSLGTRKDFYRDNAIRQGKHFNINTETGGKINFRFEFLVDVKDYFNGVWGLFKQTNATEVEKFNLNEHNFIEYQNKKFGVHVSTSGSRAAVQEAFWGYDWKNKRENPHFAGFSGGTVKTEGGPCIKGIIFVGSNDGDVVVCYDTFHAVPTRLSKGDAKQWFKIGGPDYLNEASQVAMGIGEGVADFWKKAREEYTRTLDEILDKHKGVEDMNETEYISSDGKVVSIKNSMEYDTIEGPEANEYKVNGIYDSYTVQDCYHARTIALPFRSVKTLNLTNKVPADCELITSLSAKGVLEVSDRADVINLPNASLPWGYIIGSSPDAQFRIYNTGLSPNTSICNFKKAIFQNLNLERTLVLSDNDTIFFRGITANNIYITLENKDSIKLLKFEDCDIKNIYFKAPTDKAVDLIELDSKTSSSDMVFNFEVTTQNHRSIFKKDDLVIKSSYTTEDLFSMLIERDDSLPEKEEFIEQTGFNIKDIRIK